MRLSRGSIVGGVGGSSAASYRLGPNYLDSPLALALGTYGDEFEYADLDTLKSTWTPYGGQPDSDFLLEGSSLSMWLSQASVRGIRRSFSPAANFEIAMLVSGTSDHGGMLPGFGLVDDSGNGFGASLYDNAYTWTLISYGYAGTRLSGPKPADTSRPFWLALRRASNALRFRYKTPGGAWTTIVASDNVGAFTITQLLLGRLYAGAGGSNTIMRIHRLVYGTPDIGQG